MTECVPKKSGNGKLNVFFFIKRSIEKAPPPNGKQNYNGCRKAKLTISKGIWYEVRIFEIIRRDKFVFNVFTQTK